MIVKNLYLATGIKYYGSYQGDSGEERVKLLVPAVNEDAAKKAACESEYIDELTNVRLLYEITTGCGWGRNGVWEETDGFDDEDIINLI